MAGAFQGSAFQNSAYETERISATAPGGGYYRSSVVLPFAPSRRPRVFRYAGSGPLDFGIAGVAKTRFVSADLASVDRVDMQDFADVQIFGLLGRR